MITNRRGAKALEKIAEAEERIAGAEERIYRVLSKELKRSTGPANPANQPPVLSPMTAKGKIAGKK